MSKVFEKSVSEKYSKYFSSISELTAPFIEYSLAKGEPVMNQDRKLRPWDTGIVGIPLAWSGKNESVYVDQTDTHTLVVGPTGSKKSRLVAMPLVRILGSTGESMIISDPKAEIYNRTAAYLSQKGYNVFVLNLRSPMNGQRWNPLTIPYEFYSEGEIDKAYEFVNDIAENLIHTEQSVKDPFWDNSAGSFFFGLVILLFKLCQKHGLGKEYVHMGNVIALRNILLTGMHRTNALWAFAKTDPIITSALIGTVETANETKAGILSTFDQKVRMFSIQPNLLDMLGANDFDMNRIGTEPTAVFLIVPDEKTGYHSLVSLFIKQSYEYMIFNAQLEAERDGFHTGVLQNRVNYILDEFSSLPTIRDFPAMITAARSRNIRFTLVVQSKHQLIQRYHDETETIQTNCNNWIFLTSRELRFLEEVSALCGKTVGDNPQPVLSLTDLQRLDKDAGEAVLLCGRSKPCITKLADIGMYDNNRFSRLPAEKRTPLQLPTIDSVVSSVFSERSTDVPPINLDQMEAEIDKQIAKLEKEEQRKAKKEQKKNGEKEA